MSMKMCPRGCDAFLEYVGIDDGFGQYGEMACDLWECPACGEQVVGDCLEAPQHEKTDESFHDDEVQS